MKYKFYSNSESSWKAMYSSMQDAKESIYLEMYIFDETMDKYNFLDLLEAKAGSGLRVRLILDSLGSRNLSNSTLQKLKDKGVEVFFISHFFHRTHRKILIFDERVAFIGGVNFTKPSLHWDDLVLKIEGSLVPHIIRSFANVYAGVGGTDPLILKENKKVFFDKTRTWLVEHFPQTKRKTLKKLYREFLKKAQGKVLIITPYFVPSRPVIAMLHQAVLRGVEVEVLIPRNTDHFVIVDKVNFYFINKVARLGVKFYIEPSMNHAKALIVDDKEAMVGSHNFDFLSFDFNSEIALVLKDKKAIENLLEIAGNWKKNSFLFDGKNLKMNFYYSLLAPFIRIFAWII